MKAGDRDPSSDGRGEPVVILSGNIILKVDPRQSRGLSIARPPSASMLTNSVRAVAEGAAPPLALDSEERRMLSLVDGRRSVRELTQLSGLPSAVARNHLGAMFERGVLVAADPQDSRDPRDSQDRAVPTMLASLPSGPASSGGAGERITKDHGSRAGGAGEPGHRVTLGASGAVRTETPAWSPAYTEPAPSPAVVTRAPLPEPPRRPASDWRDADATPAVEINVETTLGAGRRGGQPFRVGSYEVATRIGQGGMGSVYVCRRLGSAGFERLFTLKVVRQSSGQEETAVRSFHTEARVGGLVAHPNLQTVVDVGTYKEQPFLILDYVEGASLAELVDRAWGHRDTPSPAARQQGPGLEAGKRLPATVVVSVVLDVLRGLQAAHDSVDGQGRALGLVHGDVSPPNILIGVDGSARLCDFGSARFTAPGEARSVDPTVPGKPAYLAPEQVEGEGVDARTDIFSLGVVMWTALTGEDLFTAESHDATLMNVLRKRIPPPSAFGAPPSLDDVCLRALNRSRSARFFTAEEMAGVLLKVATAADLVASPRRVGQVVRDECADLLNERRRKTQAVFGTARRGGPPEPAAAGLGETLLAPARVAEAVKMASAAGHGPAMPSRLAAPGTLAVTPRPAAPTVIVAAEPSSRAWEGALGTGRVPEKRKITFSVRQSIAIVAAVLVLTVVVLRLVSVSLSRGDRASPAPAAVSASAAPRLPAPAPTR